MGDLASLSVVKRYIQPEGDADDGAIQDLVRFASALIRSHTGRALTTPPVTEQRAVWFSGRASARLDDKLTNITQVTGPYPYSRALTTDEYELIQFPTVTQLSVDRALEGKALVTGTWGWATVPGDIEYATIVTVDEWFRGNILPPTGSRGEGEPEGRNISLPREVQEILAPWRPGMRIG